MWGNDKQWGGDDKAVGKTGGVSMSQPGVKREPGRTESKEKRTHQDFKKTLGSRARKKKNLAGEGELMKGSPQAKKKNRQEGGYIKREKRKNRRVKGKTSHKSKNKDN